MLRYQGMVVLAASQIWWTWEVEDVFSQVKKGDKLGMKNYAKKMHTQINDLVVKVDFFFIKKLFFLNDINLIERIKNAMLFILNVLMLFDH